MSPHAALFHRSRALPATVRAAGFADTTQVCSFPAGRRLRIDAVTRTKPLTAGTQWAMPAALLGAWSMALLCDELQIDFEVALFNRGFAARAHDTDESYRKGRAGASSGLKSAQGSAADRLLSTVNHYMVKPFDRRWRDTRANTRWPVLLLPQTEEGDRRSPERRQAPAHPCLCSRRPPTSTSST